jgi:hypothetical protein
VDDCRSSAYFRAVKSLAVWIILLTGAFLLVASAPGISNGQIDTFEDGTSDFWLFGFGPLPVNLGGPGGASDHYLEVMADGNGMQGKFVAFNRNQWLGSYTLAGVSAIEMDLKAFSLIGASNMTIRIAFRSATPTGSPGYVTTFGFPLVVDGQWHHVVFDFSTFTAIGLPPPLSTVLTGPAELRIISAASPNSLTGDNLAGTLGIDNIHAIGLRIVSIARLPDKTVHLECQGIPNLTYTLQASPDLLQPFASIGSAMAAGDGTFHFDDLNASNFTQRVYRLSRP